MVERGEDTMHRGFRRCIADLRGFFPRRSVMATRIYADLRGIFPRRSVMARRMTRMTRIYADFFPM